MNNENELKHRSKVARDLRTPKYRPRVVKDKKKWADKKLCRQKIREDAPTCSMGTSSGVAHTGNIDYADPLLDKKKKPLKRFRSFVKWPKK